MLRSTAPWILATVLAFALSGFTQPVAPPAVAPPLPAVPEDMKVVRLITVKHCQELLLDPASSKNPLTRFKEFMSPDVTSFVPVPWVHGLLVMAKNEDALDQFNELITVLDESPVKAVLRIQLLKMGPTDAQALAQTYAASFKQNAKNDPTQAKLRELLAAGKATVSSAVVLTLQDGIEGAVVLPNTDFAVPALTVRLSARSDGPMTLAVTPSGWSTMPSSLQLVDERLSILATGIPRKTGCTADGVLVIIPSRKPATLKPFTDIAIPGLEDFHVEPL